MPETPVKKDVNPRNITPRTRHRLFALSHNTCSFPTCEVIIASLESEILKAQVCHIEAAEEEGQRFNPAMSNDARRSFDNLIILCPTHHTETNDVALFPVEILKKMKQDHIENMMKRRSANDIITKYPTALAEIVNIIGSPDFFAEPDELDTRKRFEIDEKIQHNQVKRFKPTIEEYAVYQGKITAIYNEIEIQGSARKSSLLNHIRGLYLEAYGDLVKDGMSVQNVADDLFSKVETKLWDIVDNKSENIHSGLNYEDRAVAIRIVMVDAFMRCKILDEPVRK